MAPAQAGQRLEEAGQQDLAGGDDQLPGVLLRGQGLPQAPVLRLELHRTHGTLRQPTADVLGLIPTKILAPVEQR